ncbi:MAG: 3'(2'),5'-bisphosphate nucleotidase CysQ [Proteobacteria bacterium]|nr:3'(2'),5'-bisphosphate nucleotidase CysQ [Pseudomonadota bacterium]
MQSAASDLSLLEEAAREAGALARDLLTKPLDIRNKGEAGPVTNVDLAIEALLTEKLRAARPDYGWLSEETPDDPEARVRASRVFMLDPIDGTAAMIKRKPQYTICIGVADGANAVAGAIYNPATDEMFLGAIGAGATMNGRAMRVTARDALEGAHIVGSKAQLTDGRWRKPWPPLEIERRESIAYRMAAVAAGQADATMLFGWKHYWDIAAGAAIIAAAGGVITDTWGAPLQFDLREPRAPGVVASGAELHPLLIERTSHFPDPRTKAKA